MKEYSGQPENIKKPLTMEYIKKTIGEVLKEDLPDCEVNEWFIESVHFANMIDEITREIEEKI